MYKDQISYLDERYKADSLVYISALFGKEMT